MMKWGLIFQLQPHTPFLVLPNPKAVPHFRTIINTASSPRFSSSSSSSSSSSPPSSSSVHPTFTSSFRCAVLGAGFAGLSVAWHLLSQSPKELKLHVDIFDDVGIGGGASGVAGGLVHPYSPKVKLLWRGEECWTEFLNLLSVAEDAFNGLSHCQHNTNGLIVRRTGILRPAVNKKFFYVMNENALSYLAGCPIQTIDEIAARKLIPNLCTPLNTAYYMPEAVNVNPLNYLKALFQASENIVKRMSSIGYCGKKITLHKKLVTSICEVGDEYDAVIVCLGARVDMVAELSGVLPLRTCRGIVAHLQLHDSFSEEYCEYSPSILSDVWLAVQGPRSLYIGSTWEWGSRNFSSSVSYEEASSTLQQLLPKTSMIYPQISNWTVTGAQAGVRAMPPLTSQGSFPLLGCIDDLVKGGKSSYPSKYWLIGGLGARGLLYHGWLGKLTAQAVLSSSEALLPLELTSWKK
ncbi:uncharacterized protein LOC130796748 [Amaranthus tricolor]|uniref:uncharacterized protein LOC130796748 n=1 Tax=Amaranthus tricolor TaxID=29722 RepID=UPI00258C3009|nr:uncharacterized protein LOC130796748 [Amaranthus tricolor]